MHSLKYRNALHGALHIVILIAASAVIMPMQSLAAESKAGSLTPPVRMKQYHVHYDVNPDGTYTELYEQEVTILDERGVQVSKRMLIGMPDGVLPKDGGKRDIEVLTAYTRQKNGQQIPATQQDPQQQINGAASAVSPVSPSPRTQLKMLVFPNGGIGDTLVFSYKVTQKEALPGNNIVLQQNFPTFVVYDDVEVSLSAPASLNLRFDVVGIEKAQNTGTGNTQKWAWRYQNNKPESFQPGAPMDMANFPRIHISSFKDNAAEAEVMRLVADGWGCMVAPGMPNDGPRAMVAYSNQMAVFFWRDARFLEQWANDWNTPSCVFDDGRPRLGALNDGYSAAFGSVSDWSRSYARIEELKRAFPDKAFVALAEADYWSDYAWNARGSGFSSSVTQDGWRLFRERLEKAEQVLNDSKTYASSIPVWYTDMVNVQSLLDRPEKERNQTFLEGAKKYKTYYPLYFAMENHLLPKWGGSWEAVDGFVKWSVENTKDVDGDSMYARLYWSAYQGLSSEQKLFKDTHASWPKMKKGFEDLMARHPKSKWNLNNFAKFACVAGDKKTYLSLRRKIGKDVIDDAWTGNASLDLCEAKYGT